MKRLKTMGLLAAAMSVLLLTACGGGDKKNEIKNVNINLLQTSADVVVGELASFNVTTENTDFEISTSPATGAGCVKASSTLVTCTPTLAGSYTLTVTATEDKTNIKLATITVTEVSINIEPQTVAGIPGQPVVFTVTTTESPDYTVSAPEGVECEKDGNKLACTPEAAETYVITVTATANTAKTMTATITGVGPAMVLVEHGVFKMGCTLGVGVWMDNFCSPIAWKSHDVSLTRDFLIGKYEVTRAQWRDVVNRTADSGHGLNPDPSEFKEFEGTVNDNLPVTNVSWDDVQTFIVALNSLPENVETGRTYRLPTEAEWEYAARGGVKGKDNLNKSWSASLPDNDWYTNEGMFADADAAAWILHNSGGTTHPVGTTIANELGIYDMSGNVTEMCSDLYNYYPDVPLRVDPTGAVEDSYGMTVVNVSRGGAWNNVQSSATVWHRIYAYNDNYSGFRLVLELPAETDAALSAKSAIPSTTGVWDSAVSGIKSLWNSITK
jgi:formylglycine-generating enzyme required for sulfatase activity